MAAKGEEAARIASNRARQDLALAGLIVNEFKSQWEPVQRLIWLGFELNLEIGKVSIPDTKLAETCHVKVL